MRRHESLYTGGRQVWEDSKGRVVIEQGVEDDFSFSVDDSLEALEEAIRLNNERASIEELMQRDVSRTGSGSKGRRRSRPPKPTTYHEPPVRGRPPLGEEKRAHVNTSIAKSTLEILRARKITLAAVFDAYVEMVVAHGG